MRRPLRSRSTDAYLSTRARLGVKFGLDTMRALTEALGHPEASFTSLLVAGTNGKGSVVAYVAAVLRAAGLKVGRYTSPHLVRVHERINVGGRDITPATLDRAVTHVRAAADALVAQGRLSGHPTYFEAVTAAAFDHFRSAGVEVAVLEVGMGGRLDATNVSAPVASAIVSLAADHEAYLGTSLEDIAREKAGILRAGRVTVLGPLPAEARRTVAEEAGRCGAILIDARDGTTVRVEGDRVHVATAAAAYPPLRPLPGAHQRDNLVVALRLLEAAHAAGVPFDPAARPEVVARGIASTRWPGRLQRIPGRPALLLDGAHNPAAARALADHLRALDRSFVLLFGAMADKDVAAMGAELFPLAAEVVLTQAPGDRAARASEIVQRVGEPAARAHHSENTRQGLALARRLATPRGLVVVAGSLYLVGEVLKARRPRSGRPGGDKRSRTKSTADSSGRKPRA